MKSYFESESKVMRFFCTAGRGTETFAYQEIYEEVDKEYVVFSFYFKDRSIYFFLTIRQQKQFLTKNSNLLDLREWTDTQYEINYIAPINSI